MSSELTKIIDAVASGQRDPGDLFATVYAELRSLAKQKMAGQAPGQTIQATELVHEAYLKVIGPNGDKNWANRSHFFANAAEAMRQILIDRARRKQAIKRGGGHGKKVQLDDFEVAVEASNDELMAINDAIDSLINEDETSANLVKLRYFSGFTTEEAAHALGISRATAYRHWKFAKAWLQSSMRDYSENS